MSISDNFTPQNQSLKMHNILRLSLALTLSVSLLTACNSGDSATKTAVVKDSVPPPKPKPTLSPEEYNKYHNLVKNYVDKYFSPRYFNGGILVAKNGVPVYERYSGFENLRTKKDSINPNSSLQIASTGKTFTSAAILKLIQEGKMGLEDSVSQFFPGFPYKVTVKLLLNHRSGLPNYLYYFEDKKYGWPRNRPATNQDVINSLMQWEPNPMANVDRRYYYCNTNFVVLASIVEKVSGMPYPQYMDANFFKPLGMSNTFVKTQADSARVIYSYKSNGGLWPPDFSDGPYGDKNIYSTPRDLLKWDQALYDETIIKQPLLDSAWTPYSFEKPSTKNYGLGWHLLILPNKKKVAFHNGKWHGFNAIFARLTDEKVTIIMTDNKEYRSIYNLARKMYELFGAYDGRSDEPGED